MADDWLIREYFALNDAIDRFDQRLLTVKGWGVTLGLASLADGFQSAHYGLFLVAALSGVSFLTIEALIKRHQMRHYLRMREIEVLRAGRPDWDGSPQIDWGWSIAGDHFAARIRRPLPPPQPYPVPYLAYRMPWLGGHVLLPHIVPIAFGTGLFALGWLGVIDMPL